MKIFNFLLVLVTLSMMFMASCSDDPDGQKDKCPASKKAECTELKQICDGSTGNCLDLCATAGCDAATQDCNWQLGTCVAKGDLCATDTTCAAEGKVCDDSTGVVVCKDDCTVKPCTAGETCNTITKICENLCEDVTCCEGKTCNPANGQCEGTCTSISTITAVRSEGILISDVNSQTPSIGEVTDIEGVVVAIRGISTSNKHGVYIRQANATEFAGIYVDFYTIKGDAAFVSPAIGDLIKVSGLHKEYFGFSQITPGSIDQYAVVTNNVSVPAPIDITVAQLEEKYESMLVNLTGGPFTVITEGNDTNNYNTVVKNNAGDEFQMKSDVMYPKYVLPVGTVLPKVTGVITFDWGYFKILPRSSADLGVVDKCAGVTCTETQYCDALTGECVEKVAENTDALCSDNIDNDGNGFVDCNDFSCSRNPDVTVCGVTNPENTDALCSDNIDNDNDGHTDCDDYDCSRSATVTVCGATCTPACETGFTCQNGTCVESSAENTDALCSDGISNDGDNYIDCDDRDCANTTPCLATVENGTIIQIRKSENNITVGDTVKTTGTVMYVYTVTGNVKGIYIQNSANDFDGIYVYISPAAQSTVVAGDKIEVTGVVTDYNGLREITTTIDKVTIQSSGNTLFTAKNITVPQLGDANESMLVNLTGGPFTVTSIGTGTTVNATLTDANGVSFTLRSSLFSFQSITGFAVGTTLSTVKGIVEEYTPANGSVTFQVKPRSADDLIITGQVTCEQACADWEACTATNTCTLKAGRCGDNEDCTVAGEECNMTTHVCEVPAAVCNPACAEWKTCTATNTCTLTTGRCESDTNCSGGATCNVDTHRCAGGTNPQFANADFSVWTDDVTPETWTKGNFPSTFSKVTRSGTDYALNMTGTHTSNAYLVSTGFTMMTSAMPASITFEMNGSGKISINIACDLNADGQSTGEQKIYNLTAETFAWAGLSSTGTPNSNAYNAFNTNGEWKTFTITTGAELADFWKEGTSCRLEIKGGKTDPFNASFDNFTINY